MSWQSGLQAAVAQIAASAIRRELAGKGRSGSGPAVSRLTVLLQRVAEHVTELDDEPVAEFLEFALDVMLEAGAGADFAMPGEFIESSDRIIERLAGRRQPVCDLLLAQARYFAVFSNSSERRRATVERAVELSCTPDETVRALLTLARVDVDGSNYTAARRLVDRCREIIGGTPLEPTHLPNLLTTAGLTYFYTDIDRAGTLFRAAVDTGTALIADPEISQTVSTAWHFLGRIAIFRGRYQDALDAHVRAAEYSSRRLSGLAYHHLRLAEILLDHGPTAQALHHLQEAKRIFARMQQSGSATAQLAAAWARYYQRNGATDQVETLLVDAVESARRDGYPRGEIAFLLRLARLRLHRHQALSAAGFLARAIRVFLRREATAGWQDLLAQFRFGGRMALRVLFPRRAVQAAEAGQVRCPCGADHAHAQPGPPMAEREEGGAGPPKRLAPGR